MKAVRSAVILTMAPLILNGVVQNVEVIYPRPEERDGVRPVPGPSSSTR